jgi:predicted RNA methylase
VRTEGHFEIPLSIKDECPDAVKYTPTGYAVLPSLLQQLTRDDVFIDLGCGKGRVVMFLAARRTIRRVIGVEIVPDLAQIAKTNLKKLSLLTRVDIIEADASKVDLSEGTVYFMFNPFGETTLRKVLDNIKKSLQARPRKIRILYHVPECAEVLDKASWLTSNGGRGSSLRVWHN